MLTIVVNCLSLLKFPIYMHFCSTFCSFPVLSLIWRSLRTFVLATHHTPFSSYPKLRLHKKELVKSCFSAMRESLKLSGCVWGGCDAVRNHRRCGWRCCPPCPDWCTVSVSSPGSQSWHGRKGVFALWQGPTPHPPLILYYVHTVQAHTCTYMQRYPPTSYALLQRSAQSCWVICLFIHYVCSAARK